MPFIKQDLREGALKGLNNEPGERCFRHYHVLMEAWRKEPRWRTIDTFTRRVWENDEQRAAALALLVFMHKHGFKYEDKQCEVNGDI